MEKNIDAHNRDVAQTGHYAYTDPNLLSARLSTTTIQEHMEELIKKYLGTDISILDVGCGDGTYTYDLYKRLKKAKITAIEPAKEAVCSAQQKSRWRDRRGSHETRNEESISWDEGATESAKVGVRLLKFTVGNAYTTKYKHNQFDLVILRSVLHHLYKPQKALKNVLQYGKFCLIVEPNGYSPLLKIIEKTSSYHRQHEERSFFPHQVRSWLLNNNFTLVENRYINLVPTFAPDWLARSAKAIEPVVEAMPIIKHLACAQNVTLWRKSNA